MTIRNLNAARRGSVINSKGRISIPVSIRERLGLKAGGRVKFVIRHDGSVVMLPVRPAVKAV